MGRTGQERSKGWPSLSNSVSMVLEMGTEEAARNLRPGVLGNRTESGKAEVGLVPSMKLFLSRNFSIVCMLIDEKKRKKQRERGNGLFR